LNSKKM